MKNSKICYFDLETQLGANDVGGWGNIHLMKMSVGVTYDTQSEEFKTFLEDDINLLIETLISSDLVVGFNVSGFDYTVLQPYTTHDLKTINTFDMLTYLYKKLGHRVSLNNLAQETLNAKKSADGLQALKWFREGKIDKIAQYCKKDVEITRDIFMYGVQQKRLFFKKKGKGRFEVPVEWDVEALLK